MDFSLGNNNFYSHCHSYRELVKLAGGNEKPC